MQTINLQGAWKVDCGIETDQEDASTSTCTICELLKSDIQKYKNQFLMRIDTVTSTITLTKFGAKSGLSISYLNFPNEKAFQFRIEGDLYLYSIIIAGDTYILKDQNQMCYLLLEKLRP